MSRPPPSSTLFPYTTLFRSFEARCEGRRAHKAALTARAAYPEVQAGRHTEKTLRITGEKGREEEIRTRPRSEEHTSELQSLRHLVCRLLLEKKNKKNLAEES